MPLTCRLRPPFVVQASRLLPVAAETAAPQLSHTQAGKLCPSLPGI
jgi:hypothetical protein